MSDSASGCSSEKSDSDCEHDSSDSGSQNCKADAVQKDIILVNSIGDEMDKIKAQVDALYAFTQDEQLEAPETIAPPQQTLILSSAPKEMSDKSTSTVDLDQSTKSIDLTYNHDLERWKESSGTQPKTQYPNRADVSKTLGTTPHASQADLDTHSSFFVTKQSLTTQPKAPVSKQSESSDTPITPDDLCISKLSTVFPKFSSDDLHRLRSGQDARMGESRELNASENVIESSSSGVSSNRQFRASNSSEQMNSILKRSPPSSLQDEEQRELDAIQAILFE